MVKHIAINRIKRKDLMLHTSILSLRRRIAMVASQVILPTQTIRLLIRNSLKVVSEILVALLKNQQFRLLKILAIKREILSLIFKVILHVIKSM